ncbi:MAG: type IV toxin-antitoxin system AbiEi family antitoxin [Bacteroidota bacterium]
MNIKPVSYRSAVLLSSLINKDQRFFEMEDAKAALENSSERAVRELIRGMVNTGLLLRMKDGLFHIIPYEADSDSYFPNWHLAAKHLVGERDYYIGYYSALQIHELITQPSLVEQIVVNEQHRPSKMTVREVNFQFIYHKENRFFGFKKTWIDDFNRVMVSDVEKTLLDCLYKPEYGNGIVEITKAIYKAKEQINYDRLLEYIELFPAQSVLKRLGFLLEGFEMNAEFVELLQSKISKSYTVLDSSLPKGGKHLSKWKLRLNLDPSTIFNAITS